MMNKRNKYYKQTGLTKIIYLNLHKKVTSYYSSADTEASLSAHFTGSKVLTDEVSCNTTYRATLQEK